MYKLLIIDDDAMIRNGIKNAVPWGDLGINDVRTASDGEEGEKVFLSFLPEIVITDIRMPGMDGLELVKRLKTHNANVKVIVLSGYDDFTYAQNAVKCGALDYLLKTADVDEVLSVIKRALEIIGTERDEIEQKIKLRQQLNMSLPLLRYRYLNELIFGYADIRRLADKLEFVGIKLYEGPSIVAVVEIDNPDSRFFQEAEEDRVLQKFIVMNIIEETLGESAVCFESKNEEFVCICRAEGSGEEEIIKLNSKFEKISEIFVQKFRLKMCIGVSNIGQKLSTIKSCYEDARKALDHRLNLGEGSIINYKDIASYTTASFKIGTDTENKLISALRVGDRENVLDIINYVFEQMLCSEILDVNNMRRVCIELFGIASMVLGEFGSGFNEVFAKEFLYFEEIKNYKKIEDAKKWMLVNFNKTLDFILNTKICRGKKIIETAKQYIDEHFSEELTLNSVAEYLYLSPNYFSSLFSKEVGQSFLEYITSRRIERAKQLLGEKDYAAFEVGEKVGYKNPHYFSRIFKKITGITPSGYKDFLNKNKNI